MLSFKYTSIFYQTCYIRGRYLTANFVLFVLFPVYGKYLTEKA